MNASVIEEYLIGKSIAELSRKYNISTYKMRKFLVDNNVVIRSQKEQNKYSPQNQRKYHINDNLFDKIDNQDKAYFLGFFAADGTVLSDGSMGFKLSTIDKEILIKFQTFLETDYPIRDYVNKDGYHISEFSFRSSKIREEFAKYNIIRNKTYTFCFPKNIPEEFYIDFIRGYWDGDGTVCLSGGYLRTSLCGYRKEVLEEIINILNEYGIPKVKIQQKKNTNTYYFQYSINSSKKLYNLFYAKIGNLFLERKYSKFKKLINDIKSHEPTTSQAEEKIV